MTATTDWKDSMSQSNTTANTIFAQLGGLAFMKELGVKNIKVIERGVEFDITPERLSNSTKRGVNSLRVFLEKPTVYTMQFIRKENMLERVAFTAKNVYGDELTPMFNTHVKGIK